MLSYSSGHLKSEMDFVELTSRCQRGYLPNVGSRRKSIPLLFLVSRDCLYSLAHGTNNHSNLFYFLCQVL